MKNIYTSILLTASLLLNVSIYGQISLEATSGIAIEATGSIELNIDGNFKNLGTYNPGTSTLLLDGNMNQELRNDNGSFYNLTVNKTAGEVHLASNLNINGGTCTVMMGDVNLNGFTITFDANATLSETAGNTIKGSSGNITTTRNLNAPNEDVAGFGLSISSSSDLGQTQIIRGHGQESGGDANGIFRFYDVTPNNNSGLNATLAFKYDESELDGQNEADLQLFYSDNGGSTWTLIGGTVNTGNNTVTASGIDELGLFTLSDGCMEGLGTSDAVCSNMTVTLDASGSASVTAPEIDGGSKGRCGIVNLSLSKTDFTCDDLGANTVTLTLTSATGETASCNAIITVEPGDQLPGGWSATDIGMATTGNDYSFDPCTATTDGEFVITGSGNNATSSTTDNVAFAGQELCGDGTITAKIESISAGGYGGLMIRESTTAGAKQVSIFSNLSSLLRHETRYTTNGMKQVNSFFKPSPIWLRLQRMGSWVFAYYSNNGVTFQYVHGVFVPMQNCVEIGLASFTYIPNAQTEATFSNVETTGNISMMAGNLPVEVENLDNKVQSGLKVFPNPNTGSFIVQFEQPFTKDVPLAIYNAFGQLIETRIVGAGTNQMEWNLENIASGTYWIHMETADQVLPIIIE